MSKPHYRRSADGRTSLVHDSLTNVVANLGTARDKSAWSEYSTVTRLSDQAALNTYRGAWLPRKIVDIPAFDSCRNWRDWQAEADQISAFEKEEKRLGLQGKVLAAKIAARLFGGAALLISNGDVDLSKPLREDKTGLGGLKYVTLLHKRNLSAQIVDDDPESEWFGQPKFWHLTPNLSSGVVVHPSRLVVFRGAEVPDPLVSGVEFGWGDSVLLSIMDAVRSVDSTAANIASLVFEAKVDTVGIPDMMSKLGDASYTDILIKRWALAETGKGINGTLMHDAEEVLGQKTASFASLPDVLDRFMQLAAGAADIPMTRLLGMSPAGMSSTGESDTRNYYDRIASEQSLHMSPAMYRLDECLIRSAIGSRPDEVHYRWASLWQMSDKERAEIGKLQADTIKVLRDTRLIPDEALSEAAVTALSESGALPGLEGAVSSYLESHPDEEATEEEEALTPPKEPVEAEPVEAEPEEGAEE